MTVLSPVRYLVSFKKRRTVDGIQDDAVMTTKTYDYTLSDRSINISITI